MQIKTWNQAPSLKAQLDACRQLPPWICQPEGWSIHYALIDKIPSLVIHWTSTAHYGALSASKAQSLCNTLHKNVPKIIKRKGIRQAYLIIASAGADVSAPFESLAAINQLLQTLYSLAHQHDLGLYGALTSPLGTFGGASLLVASTCHVLWCDQPEQLHLVGK